MFISQSPTIVQVGSTQFKIFKNFDERQPVIQMISSLIIQDPLTKQEVSFEVPSPGWDYETISKEDKRIYV